MAYTLGSVVSDTNKRSICIMAPATIANVAAPSASTAGVVGYNPGGAAGDGGADSGHSYRNRDARESTLLITGTCTAGQTLVGTFTLWGYHVPSADWYEIPVNGGTAITPVALAESDTDKITFQQRFSNLGHYDRLALQLASIGGTGASFQAWLVTGLSGTGSE